MFIRDAFLFFRSASFPASLRAEVQRFVCLILQPRDPPATKPSQQHDSSGPAFACPVEHAARARPGDDQRMLLIRMLFAEASSSAEISFAAALRIEELLLSGLGPWGGGGGRAPARFSLPSSQRCGRRRLPGRALLSCGEDCDPRKDLRRRDRFSFFCGRLLRRAFDADEDVDSPRLRLPDELLDTADRGREPVREPVRLREERVREREEAVLGRLVGASVSSSSARRPSDSSSLSMSMAELGRVSGEGGGCCCPASEVAEAPDAVRCRESVAASSGDGGGCCSNDW